MALAQTYDWVFTEPGRTLLVQSQNLGAEGERMFTAQLRLERSEKPFSRATLLWMLLWAYPVLTWRVQWWIHREAFALWWKGVAIVPHPTGATNAFVDTVHALMRPLMALSEWLSPAPAPAAAAPAPAAAAPAPSLEERALAEERSPAAALPAGGATQRRK
jgi:hypothetical protein